MTVAFRLDSVAPGLAEHFRRAPTTNRRRAAQLACERAVLAADLAAPVVGEALAALRGVGATDGSLRERLDSLSAWFDDEYFQLSEDALTPRALACFYRARAASVLALATGADESQLHEAIYESVAAHRDPAELVRLIEAALG